MPRRTKQEAAETRQRILRSALETFRERGYSGATLAEIAARIGLTKGAVYWHFETKVDLFCSLTEAMDQRADRLLEGVVADVATLDQIRTLMNGYARLFIEDPVLRAYFEVLALRVEWNVELKPARRRLEQQQRDFAELLASGLRKGQRRGRVRRDVDAMAAAWSLIALVDGVITNALIFDRGDRSSTVATAIDVYLRGLRP